MIASVCSFSNACSKFHAHLCLLISSRNSCISFHTEVKGKIALELRRRHDSTGSRTNQSLKTAPLLRCAQAASLADLAMQKQSDANGEPLGSPLRFIPSRIDAVNRTGLKFRILASSDSRTGFIRLCPKRFCNERKRIQERGPGGPVSGRVA